MLRHVSQNIELFRNATHPQNIQILVAVTLDSPSYLSVIDLGTPGAAIIEDACTCRILVNLTLDCPRTTHPAQKILQYLVRIHAHTTQVLDFVALAYEVCVFCSTTLQQFCKIL